MAEIAPILLAASIALVFVILAIELGIRSRAGHDFERSIRRF